MLYIGDNHRETLAFDDWRGGIGAAWTTFGDPAPEVMSDSRGMPAFTTAGDGVFHSGAFTRQAFPIADGLNLSATISTPITLGQWQDIEIALYGGIDTARVRTWHSDAGYLWNEGRITPTELRCGVKYPSGPEGTHYADVIRIDGTPGARSIDAPPRLRGGRLTRLTLQLLPDGRCGVALDGSVIGVTEAYAATPISMRLLLVGNSYRTKVLIGPILLRRGVDTTIDWESAPTKPR